MEPSSVRVDVWVWAVRLYPSRNAAATACKGGKVHVNGRRAKPAQPVHVGDKVEVTAPSGERVAVVTKLLNRRVGAAVARECYEDHSPPPPPREYRLAMPQRDRGAGRPTKKDRRALDRLRGY
ncbi:RNA-binding S4 domain-containing protein [Aeromicrobium phragmitis]|uniref:RNA-binding S4 domain-containing protein n=1 Tax=Aeromicrobium phragmitis TaxID=2478914 RepID=A0A3L8PLW8_9ACTN|nr:RNA-binding S4 domain-containing protein [Aeromicrobium phragmitis]RLV55528.1 RNA-binding S4 domain-containing protein [Aeromicrobium phragmitis]